MIKTLYTDRTLTVAVKPAGVPSQRDMTGDASMVELLAEQTGGPIFPVHRLDRAVGGVMVFARTKQVAARLSEAMTDNAFEKEYFAVVHGAPSAQSGEFCDYMIHDSARNVAKIVDAPTKNAKEAVLFYRTLGTAERGEHSLLSVRLGTGRTHQIRAQLSHHGMPIAGDGKYGGHDRCSMGLFSHRLTFSHPVTKKRLSFEALPEISDPWAWFSTVLFKSDNE